MEQQEQKKEFWAIVSLMGHQQLAGHLDEFVMGGCSFLRLTVPETAKQPAWTRLFKDNSIYSIDPCTEPVARYKAETLNIAPMTVWDANSMLEKQLEKANKVVVNKADLPEGFLLPETSDQMMSTQCGADFDDNDQDDDDEGSF
jgi:G3E family GTPase